VRLRSIELLPAGAAELGVLQAAAHALRRDEQVQGGIEEADGRTGHG
jgi:hypothetical protein